MLGIFLAISTLVVACPVSVRAATGSAVDDASLSIYVADPFSPVRGNRHQYSDFLSRLGVQSSLLKSELEIGGRGLCQAIALIEMGRFDTAEELLKTTWSQLVKSSPDVRRQLVPWHWLIGGKMRRHAARFGAGNVTDRERLALLGLALELIERASQHLDGPDSTLEHINALLDRHALTRDASDLREAATLYETLPGVDESPAQEATACRLFSAKSWQSRLRETAASLAKDNNADPTSRAWGHYYVARSSVHLDGVETLDHYRASVACLEQVRDGITDDRGDAAFVRQHGQVYAAAVFALYDADETWSALQFAELARPRFPGAAPTLQTEREARAMVPAGSIQLALYAAPNSANSEQRILTWAVTRNATRTHTANLPPHTVDHLVAQTSDPTDRSTALRTFHETVIAPTVGEFQESRLRIAPHGELRRIPFDAVNNGRTFLVERFVTSQVAGFFSENNASVTPAPSTTTSGGTQKLTALKAAPLRPVLALIDPSTKYGATNVAVRPPLGAARTAEGLRTFTNGPGDRIFEDADATAAVLVEFGPLARLVHVASHSEFDPTNPWRSSLFLAGSGVDGRLLANDLRALPLENVDLLVLSGCETGVGDGLAGLPRASFEAGVDQLIATITPVEDNLAARFMTRFYHHLSNSHPPVEALHRAKLDEIKMIDNADERPLFPLQWASWALFESSCPRGEIR